MTQHVFPLAYFVKGASLVKSGISWPAKSVAAVPLVNTEEQKRSWYQNPDIVICDANREFITYNHAEHIRTKRILFTHLGGGIGDLIAFSSIAEYLRNKTIIVHCDPKHERPDYLRQTLDSIVHYLPLNFRVILADDGSTHPDVAKICREFLRVNGGDYLPGMNVGVALNMLRALERCKDSKVIITLDSDFIIKRRFFDSLTKLLAMMGNEDTIITGFNASSHPITKRYSEYAEKKTIGGGNLCFTWSAYEKHIRPSLLDSMWDWRMCDSITRASGKFLCLTPSVCQHIGVISTLGHTSSDIAEDF